MDDLTAISKELEKLSKKMDMIVEAMVGDPSDHNKPGLLIRVDRVERSNTSIKRVLAIVSASLLSLAVFIVGNVIVKYLL